MDQYPQVQAASYVRDAVDGTNAARICIGLAKDIVDHTDLESKVYDHSDAMTHAQQQVEERKKQVQEAAQQGTRDGSVLRVAPQGRLTFNVGGSPRMIVDNVNN